MSSRGIRNNNPGNIRKSKDKWQGLAEQQRDKEFFTFENPCWGIRAMARILIKYQDSYNKDTVSKIITRWAPPNENDTEAYIKSVCRKTGFETGQKLDLHRFEFIEPLMKAIIQHENGEQPYTDAQITKGLVLAGVEPENKGLDKSRTIKGAQVVTVATITSAAVETMDKVSPAFPLIQTLAQYTPMALSLLVLAGVAYIVYARYDDHRKGLR